MKPRKVDFIPGKSVAEVVANAPERLERIFNFFIGTPEMLNERMPFEAWTQLSYHLKTVTNDCAAGGFWKHFDAVQLGGDVEVTTRSDEAGLLVAVVTRIKEMV